MPEMTKHLIVDLKNGYRLRRQARQRMENCKSRSAVELAIESLDGRVINKFTRLLEMTAIRCLAARLKIRTSLPYGQTTYAVEMTADGKTGKLFTLIWPTARKRPTKAFFPSSPTAAARQPDGTRHRCLPPKGLKDGKGGGVEDEATLKKALENIENMIGLDTAKRDIKQNDRRRPLQPHEDRAGPPRPSRSRGTWSSLGNPGTGKTTFAREVAEVYHALGFIEKPIVHEVKREDLVAGFVGQTALKTERTDRQGQRRHPLHRRGLCASLAKWPRVLDSKDFGREAIDTLVAAMENMREDLIVIVAGYFRT